MVEHCIKTLKALPLEQAIEPARELMKALPWDTIDQILSEMDPESSESPESPEVDTHGWPGAVQTHGANLLWRGKWSGK